MPPAVITCRRRPCRPSPEDRGEVDVCLTRSSRALTQRRDWSQEVRDGRSWDARARAGGGRREHGAVCRVLSLGAIASRARAQAPVNKTETARGMRFYCHRHTPPLSRADEWRYREGCAAADGAAGCAAAEWRCGGVRYSEKHDKEPASPECASTVRPPPGKGSCDAPT